MTIASIIFAATLALMALLFALKEREVETGRIFPHTKFLRAHSPRAEALFVRSVRSARHFLLLRVLYGARVTLQTLYRTSMTLRRGMVWTGSTLVRVGRGTTDAEHEKLMRPMLAFLEKLYQLEERERNATLDE